MQGIFTRGVGIGDKSLAIWKPGIHFPINPSIPERLRLRQRSYIVDSYALEVHPIGIGVGEILSVRGDCSAGDRILRRIGSELLKLYIGQTLQRIRCPSDEPECSTGDHQR